MSVLEVRRFRLLMNVGWTAEERRLPQPVEFDVAVEFKQKPQAATSDALEDTVCYGALCEKIRREVGTKEYRLIEKIAEDALTLTHSLGPHDAKVCVRITKVNPPVDGLLGGASFTLREMPWSFSG